MQVRLLRNFDTPIRNAAFPGATGIAVAFGGTTIAVAADGFSAEANPTTTSASEDPSQQGSSSGARTSLTD
ncbi:hypothetical protein [Corynebacterium yonathiae]|uniref:Uncharacterized protein n=1 Tax=Corynebacterium yonathiae TaxID=2913504 RepID=A0A9X3LWD6_9CORY|nr:MULTISPECIES: hypothetical protein [Corynebacterium]MCZ9295202.1 hypothetical protein [Corynebacterium yonathiae]MDK2582085.1 hypothetical protein [Corynebacterium sp. BWA136]